VPEACGFEYNGVDTPKPWGAREEACWNDVILSLCMDSVGQTKDTEGHKHRTLYDADKNWLIRTELIEDVNTLVFGGDSNIPFKFNGGLYGDSIRYNGTTLHLGVGPSCDLYLYDDVVSNEDGWHSETIAVHGWSGTPSTQVFKYKRVGRTVMCSIEVSGTAHGSYNYTRFGLPHDIDATTPVVGWLWCYASAAGTVNQMQPVQRNSADVAEVLFDWSATGWPTSGTKTIKGMFLYHTDALM